MSNVHALPASAPQVRATPPPRPAPVSPRRSGGGWGVDEARRHSALRIASHIVSARLRAGAVVDDPAGAVIDVADRFVVWLRDGR